jgi:hypothetical protein
MGFAQQAPRPAANREVTSDEGVLCKQQGCSKPATGCVTVNLKGPTNDKRPALQLGVPIRIPMCDEHRASDGSEMQEPSTL